MTELSPDPIVGTVQQMDKRLDSIERRLDGIETRQREDAGAINQRLDDGLKAVNQRLDDGSKAVNQRLDDGLKAVNRRVDWLIGIHFGTFIALVGLLVTILLKLNVK